MANYEEMTMERYPYIRVQWVNQPGTAAYALVTSVHSGAQLQVKTLWSTDSSRRRFGIFCKEKRVGEATDDAADALRLAAKCITELEQASLAGWKYGQKQLHAVALSWNGG